MKKYINILPTTSCLSLSTGLDNLVYLLITGTIIASIFSVSSLFPDILIDAKHYFTWILGLLTGMALSIRLCCKKAIQKDTFVRNLEVIILITCTFQALLFMLQRLGIHLHYDCNAGSFDNIAGFASCLSISLPIGWRLLKCNKVAVEIIVYIAKAICIIAIVWSQSRTGMICVVFFLLLITIPRNKRKWLCSILPIIIVTLFYKSDSSKGRWFILQRSMDMIKQHPWLGWGKDGFETHYMDIQATYFMTHSNSQYEMLADNIRHPLNEWIAATIDFGFIGLFFIFIFFSITMLFAIKHSSKFTSLGLMILAVIGIFSCFSYPFQYPFTWLMLTFSLGCIYNKILHHPMMMPIAIISLCCCIYKGYKVSIESRDNMKLKEIIDKSNYGLSERMLPKYAELYPRMKHDCRFLFYYSSDLYLAEKPKLALAQAKACREALADYELTLLIGDIYKALGNKDSTLYYYNYAHNMCPSRFTPLYEIYHVYKKYGDTLACQSLQKIILKKPIKIKSKEIERIIEEVRHQKW